MLPGQHLEEITHFFDQFNAWKISWKYRDILHHIEISWNIVCIVKKQYCSGVVPSRQTNGHCISCNCPTLRDENWAVLHDKGTTPVLESDAEPGGRKFMQLGAWENAYFATRSKSRQKCVNCIILANLWNLWCFFTPWSWNYQYVGTVLSSQKSETHSSKKKKSWQRRCAAGHISNQLGDTLTLNAAAELNRPTAKTCFCRLREG